MTYYNVMDIIRGTTVDGPGFRTSIYFAGCNHRCPGCHNPSTWPFDAGRRMSMEEILDIVREEDFDVTLSGGDPLMHPHEIALLAKEIKALGKNIWLYTGYTCEEIAASESLMEPMPWIDTIVEGPFIEALKDPDLPFRGSSNQRILPPPCP